MTTHKVRSSHGTGLAVAVPVLAGIASIANLSLGAAQWLTSDAPSWLALTALGGSLILGGTSWAQWQASQGLRRRLGEQRGQIAAAGEEAALSQAVLESLPYPVFYKDRASHLLGGNAAFRQAFAVDQAEFAAARLDNLDDAPAPANAPTVSEVALPFADGSQRQVLLRECALATADGRWIGITGTIVDISESKRMEHALRQAEERYRAIFNTSQTPFVLLDGQGRLMQFNAAWAAMLGYDMNDISALAQDWCLTPPAATGETGDGTLRQSHETAFVRRDGSLCWGEVRLICPVQSGDAVTAYLAIVIDVTDRHQLEENLRVAWSEAQAANQAKSQFLATMSHEIRTPMNGVIGLLQLLKMTPLRRDQAEMVSTVMDSAVALLTIINDILDFSKIEAGKMTLEQTPMPLASLVEGVADTLSATARHKGLRLCVFVDPILPSAVLADSVRLRQILMNLTGNAIKFTESGRVVLAARLAGTSADDRPIIAFSVADTGIGIDAKAIERLFEPFTQAESSTTRRFGGSGLGLSISRRLAALMGAELEVDSIPGQGSTFHFSVALPAAEPPESPRLPSLNGLRCRFMVSDADEQDYLTRYILAAGGRMGTDDQWDVTVVDSNLAGWNQEGSNSIVLLADDPDASAEYRVVTRPVRRAALVEAVAAAAGRLSDEDLRPMVPATATHPQLVGRVLVAEDHPVNRKVLARQLQGLGLDAHMAEDGRQALNAWRQGGFDLILTDCNMPELDGYDLARTIRAEEAGSSHRVPIVAVTANALHHEVTQCTSAGMDDVLTKPLLLEDLEQVLRRWLPAAPIPPAPAETAAVAASAPADAVSPPNLLDLAVLRRQVADDDAFLAVLLADFALSADETLAQLREAAGRGDTARCAALAHRLKGSAAAAGARGLSAAAALLETAAKAGGGDTAHLLRLFHDVDAIAQHVLDHIRSMSWSPPS